MYFVWLLNVCSDSEGRIRIKGIWEQSAEVNIWKIHKLVMRSFT
jgi:hypothetical protein